MSIVRTHEHQRDLLVPSPKQRQHPLSEGAGVECVQLAPGLSVVQDDMTLFAVHEDPDALQATRHLHLAKWRRGERAQLRSSPPEGVVAVGGAHVKQAFPLGRLYGHPQLPVLTLPYIHLQSGTEREREMLGHARPGRSSLLL